MRDRLTVICGIELNVVGDVVHELLDVLGQDDLLGVLGGHEAREAAARSQLQHRPPAEYFLVEVDPPR